MALEKISAGRIIKYIVCCALISVMVFGLSIYRIEVNDDDTGYKNSDATYHVLLTVHALNETKASIHKWLPTITLGNDLNKNARWGDLTPDKFGNYYYFSFPQLGYIAPYVFLKSVGAEITYQNLVNFNFFLGWLAAIALFFFIKKLTLTCFSSPSFLPATLSAIAYATSLEFLFSHGYNYWGQSLSQVFFICFLYYLHDAITIKSKRSYLLILLFGLLFAATEWTGYVCLLVSMLYFLPKALRFDKPSLTAFCVLGVTGLLAASSFILPVMTVIGNYKDLYQYLFIHAKTRSFYDPFPFVDLLWGYYHSFGFYILAIFPLSILVFTAKKLLNKNTSSVKISPYMALLIIAFLTVALENTIMKQHATSYTYDRLKLIIPITMLIPYLWTTRPMLGYLVKLAITALILKAAFINIKEYPNRPEIYKAIGIAGNDVFVKNVNLEKSIMVAMNHPKCYLAVLFHKNFFEGSGLHANNLLNLANKNNAEQVTMINSVFAPGPGFRKVIDLDVYDLNQKKMIKYTKTECDKKSTFIKKADGLFQCEYSLRDLKEDTAFNVNDDDWKKGISTYQPGFLVMGTEYLYMAGQQVMFSNQEKRTITEVIVDPPFLEVYVDGAPLDGDVVGWPNPIKRIP